jgi:poly-beta-1,6-N-acetyl-D-glucosamine N-deacetylase
MQNIISYLKYIIALFTRLCGIPLIIREFYARNKVTILVYHNPKKEIFEKHLRYLSKRYQFITLNTLVKAIYLKNWSFIPPKSLIITFDDGHKENYYLLKAFKKYRVIPTIYLCSGIVNTNRHYWWSKLDDNEAQNLKKKSNFERLDVLNKKYNFTNTKEYKSIERQALNIDEINLMKNFVDFQSHTHSHPILTTCSDEEVEKEISQSKKELEKLINKECRHFAFPNGDYFQREIEIVKNKGYFSARTVDIGFNDRNVDPFKLKAIVVNEDDSITWLSIKSTGTGYFIRLLWAKISKVLE